MKIGLNVFSCSRFRELAPSLESYCKQLSDKVWKNSYLHEDFFKDGLEEIKGVERFTRVRVTRPCMGLGHAFYKVYTDPQVKNNDYNIHLEDDWIMQGECCEEEVVELMKRNGLLQVYLVSKKTLEQGIEKTKRKPDYFLDGKRLGLFIGSKKEDRMGHMVPNTTPHIGEQGLFDNFIVKMRARVAKNKGKINPYIDGKSPLRAWKIWGKGLPRYQHNRHRYGFLVQADLPLMKHIGTKTWHRINTEDNRPIIKGKKCK